MSRWPPSKFALLLLGVGALLGSSASIRRPALTASTPWQVRCQHSVGSWCRIFHEQQPIAWRPAPRGNMTCPQACSERGVCQHDVGICMCPAGWTGPDCGTRQRRPCTSKHSPCASPLPAEPLSTAGPDGRDLSPYDGGNGNSRCSGVCDLDIAMCWCDGPKGYIPAPEGSPPGTPPIRRARPMVTPEFQLRNDKDGKDMAFHGTLNWDDLYGPQGWCVADEPKRTLPCILDGYEGQFCDQMVENFCLNQCSGHGTCALGFCMCDKGWYGMDCARKAAGLTLEPSKIPTTPWLRTVVKEPPAAAEPPPAATRLHPLIYIYDLEPLYNTKLLQYRIAGSWCSHRRYLAGNVSNFMDHWGYAADQLLLEALMQSPHRTFDPEEADFYYVPWFGGCIPYPIYGFADFPRWAPHDAPRVALAAMSAHELQQWLAKTYPYWNRRNGRDHIWTFSHDEGACWAPNSIKESIWLVHWGRLDLNHTSNTAFYPDNYSHPYTCQSHPGSWLALTQGHACYNATKDLVIPGSKSTITYGSSTLMGKPAKDRQLLLFFRGDVGTGREPRYSRGIRQTLHKLATTGDWKRKYGIIIASRVEEPGDYGQLITNSKFCLVAPGDGWSPRMEDCMLHGSIPVIIKDDVHDVFESILDYSKFAVRIAQADMHKLPDILTAMTPAQVVSLQYHLGKVWHRFRWSNFHMQAELGQTQLEENTLQRRQGRSGGGTSTRRLLLDATTANTQMLSSTAQCTNISSSSHPEGMLDDAIWSSLALKGSLSGPKWPASTAHIGGSQHAALRDSNVSAAHSPTALRKLQQDGSKTAAMTHAVQTAEQVKTLAGAMQHLATQANAAAQQALEALAQVTRGQGTAAGHGAGGGTLGSAWQQQEVQGQADSPMPGRLYPRPFVGDITVDDAFATIMQWLHSRIPGTR